MPGTPSKSSFLCQLVSRFTSKQEQQERIERRGPSRPDQIYVRDSTPGCGETVSGVDQSWRPARSCDPPNPSEPSTSPTTPSLFQPNPRTLDAGHAHPSGLPQDPHLRPARLRTEPNLPTAETSAAGRSTETAGVSAETALHQAGGGRAAGAISGPGNGARFLETSGQGKMKSTWWGERMERRNRTVQRFTTKEKTEKVFLWHTLVSVQKANLQRARLFHATFKSIGRYK